MNHNRVTGWAVALAAGVVLQWPGSTLGASRPDWAYPQVSPARPAPVRADRPESVPGSRLHFTQAQIDDLSNTVDWFPERHPAIPGVVLHGRGPVLACAACHLTSGMGHPESARLAGLPAQYIERQLREFKDGDRRDNARMSAIGGALAPTDAHAAAEWFAELRPHPWFRVVETRRVPRSYVDRGRMRLPLPGGGSEPLGARIVELPQDATRTLRRDPNSGFITYVPPGSVARGRILASTGGGKTVACTSCHGADLRGRSAIPNQGIHESVPGIAGSSALYLARQLYSFQIGTRAGAMAAVMKPIAATLSDEDLIDLAAYAASLPP
ncbi:MAG TPA: c-type cytochrome [Steroidobacteraceae bacterium]|nr:c-type cytochrome [Steroidobacteraceae bacterium]